MFAHTRMDVSVAASDVRCGLASHSGFCCAFPTLHGVHTALPVCVPLLFGIDDESQARAKASVVFQICRVQSAVFLESTALIIGQFRGCHFDGSQTRGVQEGLVFVRPIRVRVAHDLVDQIDRPLPAGLTALGLSNSQKAVALRSNISLVSPFGTSSSGQIVPVPMSLSETAHAEPTDPADGLFNPCGRRHVRSFLPEDVQTETLRHAGLVPNMKRVAHSAPPLP